MSYRSALISGMSFMLCALTTLGFCLSPSRDSFMPSLIAHLMITYVLHMPSRPDTTDAAIQKTVMRVISSSNAVQFIRSLLVDQRMLSGALTAFCIAQRAGLCRALSLAPAPCAVNH